MVFEKIQAIIVEELGKDAEEVQLTTNIEDGIQTVQDLVTYVEKQQAN